MPRPKGTESVTCHKWTDEEKAYIKNDVLIMAKALKITFEQNLTKMTRASCAINDYKEIITKNKFNHYFPKLDYEVDKDLRKSYKGGFTYLNPIYNPNSFDFLLHRFRTLQTLHTFPSL